jgi:hypothetical protein
MTTFLITPTVAATAEAGQKFMGHLVTRARLSARITFAAILTVVAGGWLYWIDSDGFTSAWERSGPGIGFGIGAFAALIGFGFGLLVGKNATLISKLAVQGTGQPSPELLGRIKSAGSKMRMANGVSTAALIVALVCMATARYWLF